MCCLLLRFIAASVQANFAGLPWDAVNLKAGTITVKQRADERGVIGSPKTVASRRTISIPSFLVTMLREWKIECAPGPLVFGNIARQSSNAIRHSSPRHGVHYRVAAKITKADGSPRLNFHCLRHFRASMLIADGANPKEVMVEMGHSNIAMTYDLYGHLFTDDDADTRRAERAERLAILLAPLTLEPYYHPPRSQPPALQHGQHRLKVHRMVGQPSRRQAA